MAKQWISGAVRHPGALTATARRLGILKDPGGELTDAMLTKLESHADRTANSHLKRQVSLARTLRKIAGGG